MKLLIIPFYAPSAENEIMKAFLGEINKRMRITINRVTERVREYVHKMLMDSPAVQSIYSGHLKADLGHPNPDVTIRPIIDYIVSRVHVTFRKFNWVLQTIRGVYEIHILAPTIDELTNIPNAVVVTEHFKILPWLDWLLNQGGKVIVYEHEVVYNLTSRERLRSRTGLALMRKIEQESRGWRVPPKFQGTPNDNFITRALIRAERAVTEILGEAMEMAFSG